VSNELQNTTAAKRKSDEQKNDKKSGANPATLSYNASVVKIYSATNSTARF
jgi:hypothetical protein